MKRISLVAFGLALSMAYAHGSGWSENIWYGEANRDPQWSPDGAKLAFVSYRDYNAELYVMNADGSGQTRLTANDAHDLSPAWSPDGAKIAFQSDRDGEYAVYVMSADGTAQTRLADTDAQGGYTDPDPPAWSPDGRKIAFATHGDIWVMNADGSAQTELTDNGWGPAWSPGGANIAFVSYYGDPSSDSDAVDDVCVMNGDGSGRKRLTEGKNCATVPRWSPDGRTLAFASETTVWGDEAAYVISEVYVMNADGSGQKRLTQNLPSDSGLSWSPDGRKIALTGFGDSTVGICVIAADGSAETFLTNDNAGDTDTVWSPDGGKIAFVSGLYWNDDREIYVINPDGSGLTQLTDTSRADSYAVVATAAATEAAGGKGIENVIAYESGHSSNENFGGLYLVSLDGKRHADVNYRGSDPVISPDGREIACITDPDNNGYPDVSVINADGSGQIFFIRGGDGVSKPSWSPDGLKIAFASEVSRRDRRDNTSRGDIVVVDIDRSAAAPLNFGDDYDRRDAAWSPDGRKIAFTLTRDEVKGIAVARADGSGETRLADKDVAEGPPAWSPDGRKIAFTSDRDGNDEIYVVNADGSRETRLTENFGPDDGEAAWSPDGRKIAFTSDRDGNDEIYVMNADGSFLMRLTNNDVYDSRPVWSPDGAKLAFESRRGGDDHNEIFIINADGSGLTRLTYGGGYSPSFSPMRVNGVLYDTYGHIIKE